MNFFSHKIVNPAGNTATWDEWVDDYLNKTASEAKPECDDDPRGQCRGQVVNNDNEEGAHSYQEGESVDGKKDQAEGGSKDKESNANAPVKEADCAKDMGECSKAGDVTEEHSDASNADVGNAACEQNINNDPNYQKGESTNPGKVDGKNKKTDGGGSSGSGSGGGDKGSEDKEASAKGTTKTAQKRGFKKIACLNRKEKLELFAHLSAQKTASGTPKNPMPYVEAMVGMTYANMKDDEKAWFKKFWLTMYPDSYVTEMVSDR